MSSELPNELPQGFKDRQEVDDILADPESGSGFVDEVHGFSLDADTGESVARFIDAEFSSAVETEEKEAAIQYILDRIPEVLKRFGLENSSNIDTEMVDELMGYGYEDVEDIENLYFHVWDKFREEFGPFTKIRPEYMMDFATRKDSDELEKEQRDHAIYSLIKVGVDADDALDVKGNPTQRRNMRRLSWILDNEPSMEELIKTLQSTRPEGAKVGVQNLAEYVYNYLCNLREKMMTMDIAKMDNLDRNKHRGQIGFLKCSIALAESIVESSQQEQE